MFRELIHAPMKILKQSFRNIVKKQIYFPQKAPTIYRNSTKKMLPKNPFEQI